MVLLLSVFYFAPGKGYYQIALRGHLLLALALVALMWFHIGTGRFPHDLLKWGSAGYIATHVCRWIWNIVMNTSVRWKKGPMFVGGRIVHLSRWPADEQVTVVEIRPRRAITVRPGQHIYLCVPQLRLVLHDHPFMVVWWGHQQGGMQCQEVDTQNANEIVYTAAGPADDVQLSWWGSKDLVPGRTATSVFLVVYAQMGWTRSLGAYHASGDRVLISGPFGRPIDLEYHHRLFLFASGSGMAAILPLLTDLVSKKDHQRETLVIWQLGDGNPTHNEFRPWVDNILHNSRVKHSIWVIQTLRANHAIQGVKFHIHSAYEPTSSSWTAERLRFKESVLDLTEYVTQITSSPEAAVAGTYTDRSGSACRLTLAVSAYPELRNDLEWEVSRHPHSVIRFVKMDYQPSTSFQHKKSGGECLHPQGAAMALDRISAHSTA